MKLKEIRKDFREEAEKEKKELEDSYRESVRQTKERKALDTKKKVWYRKIMKKFKIRLIAMGMSGTAEVLFNGEPTLDIGEDRVAVLLDEGLLKLEPDKFHQPKNFKGEYRYRITYEEIEEEREKKLILGEWIWIINNN